MDYSLQSLQLSASTTDGDELSNFTAGFNELQVLFIPDPVSHNEQENCARHQILSIENGTETDPLDITTVEYIDTDSKDATTSVSLESTMTRKVAAKVRKNLSKDGPRVKCPQCMKILSCGANLAHHVRTHTGERPFQCDECGASFAAKTNLRTHKRTHTGERPYMCGICGKKFSQSSHLPSHMRIHTGDKPYCCPECPKSFSSKTTMKNHLRLHKGECPFVCEHCNRGFVCKSWLLDHYKVHSDEKPFKCEVCQKCFKEKSYISKHMKKYCGNNGYKKRWTIPGIKKPPGRTPSVKLNVVKERVKVDRAAENQHAKMVKSGTDRRKVFAPTVLRKRLKQMSKKIDDSHLIVSDKFESNMGHESNDPNDVSKTEVSVSVIQSNSVGAEVRKYADVYEFELSNLSDVVDIQDALFTSEDDKSSVYTEEKQVKKDEILQSSQIVCSNLNEKSSIEENGTVSLQQIMDLSVVQMLDDDPGQPENLSVHKLVENNVSLEPQNLSLDVIMPCDLTLSGDNLIDHSHMPVMTRSNNYCSQDQASSIYSIPSGKASVFYDGFAKLQHPSGSNACQPQNLTVPHCFALHQNATQSQMSFTQPKNMNQYQDTFVNIIQPQNLSQAQTLFIQPKNVSQLPTSFNLPQNLSNVPSASTQFRNLLQPENLSHSQNPSSQQPQNLSLSQSQAPFLVPHSFAEMQHSHPYQACLTASAMQLSSEPQNLSRSVTKSYTETNDLDMFCEVQNLTVPENLSINKGPTQNTVTTSQANIVSFVSSGSNSNGSQVTQTFPVYYT